MVDNSSNVKNSMDQKDQILKSNVSDNLLNMSQLDLISRKTETLTKNQILNFGHIEDVHSFMSKHTQRYTNKENNSRHNVYVNEGDRHNSRGPTASYTEHSYRELRKK